MNATGLQNCSRGLQNRFQGRQGSTPFRDDQKPFSGRFSASYNFPELEDAFSRMEGCDIGRREKDILFNAAISDMENLQAGGYSTRKAKQMCLRALWGYGVSVAPTYNAARIKLNRTIESRVYDHGFPEASWKLPEADRLILLARITEAGGRMAQGWRDAIRKGELSPETSARFKEKPYSKSWVPKSIRAQLRPYVRELQKLHRGKKNFESKGAYISRDWGKIHSGDWFSGDDATLNHYYFIKNPDSSYEVLRGQTLLFCDLRSRKILYGSHVPARNYTARTIRESIRAIHDTVGFPREGFYFEQGIWKKSRILTGASTGERSLDETEEGLRPFVKFKHALSPQAKGVIERIIGLIQNLMEPLPGYVGRDEKRDRYEDIQKKLLQAKSGKIRYESFLLSYDEYLEEVKSIVEKYNAQAQEGALEGLSPDEAWFKFFNWDSPLLKLPPAAGHLLSHHRKKVKIGRNGIRLTFKGESRYYRNAETGKLIGREVIAWFNTQEEIPSSITITDAGLNYIGEVAVEIRPSAMGATSEEIRTAQQQAKSHNKPIRDVYREIQPLFTASGMIRQIPADAETAELGELIEKGRGDIRSQANTAEAQEAEARRLSRVLGYPYNRPKNVPIERYLDGLRLEHELLEEENANTKKRRF